MVITDNGAAVEMTVGKTTNVHNLAISIFKTIGEGKKVRLVAIGANAVNQMAKGAAKSRAFLAPVGKDVGWKVYFTARPISEEERAERALLTPPSENGEEVDQQSTLSAMVFESLML